VVASVTPATSANYVVNGMARVAGLGIFRCFDRAFNFFLGAPQSSTPAGVDNLGATPNSETIATTGVVFGGPSILISEVCQVTNAKGSPLVDDAALTATQVSTANRQAKPLHLRPNNQFSIPKR
jgi:hypothetical protein